MAREDLVKLAQRFHSDAAFREHVRRDPEGAAAHGGINLSGDEKASLKSVPWHLSDDQLVQMAHDSTQGKKDSPHGRPW